MLVFLLSYLIMVVLVLVSVMFITLLERKILSYDQNRVGPNKVSYMGLVQPALDGLKLVLKEIFFGKMTNKFLFLFSPFLISQIMLILWTFLIVFNVSSVKFVLLFFLCLIGVSVYSSLLSGWSSNSKYGLLGAVRASAVALSYEVCFSFFLFFFFICFGSLGLSNWKETFGLLLVSFPILSCWVICVLSETGRAPIDFVEGESELVSGFNVEYGSSSFALLFIGEYGMVVFFSFLSSFVFSMSFFVLSVMFLYIFLHIRACFPRFRYDKFMMFTWKVMIPVSLIWLMVSFSVSFL